MSDLQDIQLNIVINVQGLESIQAAQKAMTGVATASTQAARATNEAAKSNYRSIRSWGDLQKKLRDTEISLDAVWRAGVHLSALGGDLQRFGMGLLTPLGEAAKRWGDFEFMMNRAAAAAGIFSTTAPMYKQLKEAIYAAAQETRLFKPEEIAQATYFWQSTTGENIKTQGDLVQMMKNVTEAMKTAAMTQTGYESVIKGSYSIMKQYGLSMKDIPDILHGLFVETQRTALELPDLIQSFKYVGPLAHSLGMSFEDVSKTLGILGDLGQRGSMAGRALSMLLTQIVRPAPKGIKAMNDLFKATLGVTNGYKKLVFPKGKFIGFEKFVSLLANSTKNLTQQQKLNYITTIVGTQNAARVIIPLIDAQIEATKRGTSVFADQKYSLAGASKSFESSFNILSNSWKGLVGLLQQTVAPIILEVGSAVAKALAPFVDKVAEALKVVQKWVRENPKLVDMAVKIAGVAGAAMVLMGVFFSVLGSLILLGAGIAFVISAFGGIIMSFGALAAVIGVFAAAVFNNTAGIRDNLTRLANELKKLFAPAGDAVVSFKDKIKEAVDWIRDNFGGVIEKVSGFIGELADKVAQINADPEKAKFFGELAANIAKLVAVAITIRTGLAGLNMLLGFLWALVRIGTGIDMLFKFALGLKTLAPVLAKVAPFLFTAAGGLSKVGLAMTGIGAVVVALFTAYETNFLGFRDFVNGIIGWITGTLIPGIQKFIGDVGNFISTVATNAGNFLSWVGAQLSAFGSWLVSSISGVIAFFVSIPGTVANAIASVVGAVVGFVTSIPGMVLDFLTNLKDNFGYYLGYILGFVIGTLYNIITNIIKFVGDAWGAFSGWLSSLPGLFANWFGSVLGNLIAWFAKTIPWVIAKAGEFVSGIVDWIAKLPGRIMQWFNDTLAKLGAWFGSTLPFVAGKAADIVTSIVSYFIDLPGRIINSITSLAKQIGDFMWTIPGKIWDAVKNIGEQIIKGIWKGITGIKDWFEEQVGGFFGGLVDGIKESLGIRSPSTVMAEVGKNLILGLAGGINSTTDAMSAMQNYTRGLASIAAGGADSISMSLSAMAAETAGGIFSVTGKNEATLNVQVDVTSGDGSVSQVQMTQLADILNGPDFISTLEHMATVG